MRIAIYGNEYQLEHLSDLNKLFTALEKHDAEVEIERQFFDYLTRNLGYSPKAACFDSVPENAGLAISVGGDGTFLRTARKVALLGLPILGINTGHLGYLADVSAGEIDTVIDMLDRGDYLIESRSLLEVVLPEGMSFDFPYALNEVAILKQDTSSMIEMRTEINGIPLTTYQGDGLIIATPTGSTAYNLSVGGPIIDPASCTFAISPVAAHSLTMRPLVVNDDSVIDITTSSRASAYRLSLDGRCIPVPVNSAVRVRRADFTVKVVQKKGHNFASTLRNKLMWGMANR